MTLREPLTDAEDAALRDVISQMTHGAMVTKYVIVAETVDPASGEPLIEDLSPDAQPVWDSFGLLDFTLSSWRYGVAFNVHDDD